MTTANHILVFDFEDDSRVAATVERVPLPARAPSNDVRPSRPVSTLDFCRECRELREVVAGVCGACAAQGLA